MTRINNTRRKHTLLRPHTTKKCVNLHVCREMIFDITAKGSFTGRIYFRQAVGQIPLCHVTCWWGYNNDKSSWTVHNRHRHLTYNSTNKPLFPFFTNEVFVLNIQKESASQDKHMTDLLKQGMAMWYTTHRMIFSLKVPKWTFWYFLKYI